MANPTFRDFEADCKSLLAALIEIRDVTRTYERRHPGDVKNALQRADATIAYFTTKAAL